MTVLFLRTGIVVSLLVMLAACTTVDLTHVPSSQTGDFAPAGENPVTRQARLMATEFKTQGWDIARLETGRPSMTDMLLGGGQNGARQHKEAVDTITVQDIQKAGALLSRLAEAAYFHKQNLDEQSADLDDELIRLESAYLLAVRADKYFTHLAQNQEHAPVLAALGDYRQNLKDLQAITNAYGDHARRQLSQQAQDNQAAIQN